MRRTVIRYSEAFKLQVVEEVERGASGSLQEVRHKYGIKGSHTIKHWLKKYGRQHLLPKVVRVESMKEKDRIKELKKRNRELEKALADAKVREVISEAYFEIACEEFGITDLETFKKKADAKLFSGEK